MKVYKVQHKETGEFWISNEGDYDCELCDMWETLKRLKYRIEDKMWSDLRYPDVENPEKKKEWRKNFLDKYDIIEYNVVESTTLTYEELYGK